MFDVSVPITLKIDFIGEILSEMEDVYHLPNVRESLFKALDVFFDELKNHEKVLEMKDFKSLVNIY